MSRTLRFRLILWYSYFVALTVLGFSAFLYFELQANLSRQVNAGLQVAASQLLVDVDDTVDPPVLRPLSPGTVDELDQTRFALRLVDKTGKITTQVGNFPMLPFSPDNEGTSFQTAAIEGTQWRIYTQRIKTQAREFDVWLQMAQSLNVIDDARNNLLGLIGLGLPLTIIIAIGSGTFIANRALQPVDAITRTAQAINAAGLSHRIHYKGPADELGRLAQTLNSMLGRLETAFMRERRFIADASHELRTPLTALKGQITVALSRRRSTDEYENTLQHLNRETDRLIRLTNDLLFLARLDAQPVSWQPEQVDLGELLQAVIDQVEPIATDKQIAIQVNVPEKIVISGLPEHLIRLFLNLLDNAIKYTSPGGQISVYTKAEVNVHVIVQDNGSGIAAEHLPHLFERFYRVAPERSAGGTGLGLAIAAQIAAEHHGSIQVESTLGVGTTFTISFSR